MTNLALDTLMTYVAETEPNGVLMPAGLLPWVRSRETMPARRTGELRKWLGKRAAYARDMVGTPEEVALCRDASHSGNVTLMRLAALEMVRRDAEVVAEELERGALEIA